MNLNVGSFTPLWGNIVVEPDFIKSVTGLIIPDTVKENKTPYGTVISVGPQMRSDLKPGDRVMVKAWQGQPIEIMGAAALIMDESFVVGKITDVPTNVLELVRN